MYSRMTMQAKIMQYNVCPSPLVVLPVFTTDDRNAFNRKIAMSL